MRALVLGPVAAPAAVATHQVVPHLPPGISDFIGRGGRRTPRGRVRPCRWCPPIGIARVIRTGECDAEIAVAVVGLWQRRGVGRLLLAASPRPMAP